MAKTIMIVEDDARCLKLMRDILQVSGYRTLEATDGEQSIKLAKTMKPDLILMDIMMPVVDGYTACHEIKMDKTTKKIPVIMLTSLDYELNNELGKAMGAAAYVTKPVDLKKLLSVVHRFLPIS